MLFLFSEMMTVTANHLKNIDYSLCTLTLIISPKLFMKIIGTLHVAVPAWGLLSGIVLMRQNIQFLHLVH